MSEFGRELIESAKEAVEMAREHAGFFAQLTPEQQKAALEYRGPESHGDPKFLRGKIRIDQRDV